MRLIDSSISDNSDPDLDEEEENEEEVVLTSPPSDKPNTGSSSSEVSTPTAAEYPSVCKTSTADDFVDRYGVPPEYGLCAPTSDHRANAPPPGYAAIYTHHFLNGLRLPLPLFVASELDDYKIALAQLHPNSIITLLGFMEICEKISVAPTTILFRHFFRLQRSCVKTEGWYSFNPIPPKIVFGQASSVPGWKKSFLFFKTAPMMAENVVEPQAEEEERTIDVDVPIASFKKSCNSTKSSTTESPSAACGQKRLKRMAESHATQPAKTPRGPTGKTHLDDGSKILSVPSLKGIALEQFARYIQKCVCSFNLQLQGDKEELEKIVVAREQDIKVRDSKIALLEAEVSRLNNVCNDRGNLLKVYTRKLLKTLGFAAFFKDLTTSVRSLGRHEAAKLVQKRCPDVPKVALEGLEDPLAASKLDNQFFNMVQDDGFEFPLLNYLLSLEEIPSSSQLQVLDVDEDKNALIPPKPLPAKARKNQ